MGVIDIYVGVLFVVGVVQDTCVGFSETLRAGTIVWMGRLDKLPKIQSNLPQSLVVTNDNQVSPIITGDNQWLPVTMSDEEFLCMITSDYELSWVMGAIGDHSDD